jgi:hypothetical protein
LIVETDAQDSDADIKLITWPRLLDNRYRTSGD